jgi:C_GCAxxG_C_C family probable redox protein
MIFMEWKNQAGKRAFDYHGSGFHCAEAVLKAILETCGQEDVSRDIPRVATAFGGGVGRTQQDICGALAGGAIALGCLFGRDEPGADWSVLAESAAEMRRRFVQKFGTTRCGCLLADFGPQEDEIRCRQLSGEVADLLMDVLERRGLVRHADY